MIKNVTMFTDGACSGNPGRGGVGVVLLAGKFRKEISKGFKITTNNRMELLAVIEGLKALKFDCNVTIYSDSQYLTNSLNMGWLEKWKKSKWMNSKKEKVKNLDLWKELDHLLALHKVKFVWIKGHENNKENNRADKLARDAIDLTIVFDDKGFSIQ